MQSNQRVIALGFFDGVHIGHGALLSLAVQRAMELGVTSAALTFDVHPTSLILHTPTPLLTSPADRAGLMRRCYGIEDVIVCHYDQAMMRTSWQDFITEYLVKEHHAVHLVVGHDFHFGYRGEGNPQLLQGLCAQLGIGCDVVPKVEREGITVSSTYIRSLIAQGEMDRAVSFLGHPHVLTGTVVHGKHLGSVLGFPTVNIPLPSEFLPPAYGVYAARAVLPDGSSYPAVTNVGVRPSLDDGDAVTVEAFLLRYDGSLYGKEVRLEFYSFFRPERKFDSLDGLRAEVLRNARQCEEYFEHHQA